MPITIRFSKPLDFSRHGDRDAEPLVLRQITDEIMFELREHSGQEYVNSYAKRKDQESAEVPEPARIASATAEAPPVSATANA
jgi:1-acyl-sn-glycerol-3-phosphate acyltransferase